MGNSTSPTEMGDFEGTGDRQRRHLSITRQDTPEGGWRDGDHSQGNLSPPIWKEWVIKCGETREVGRIWTFESWCLDIHLSRESSVCVWVSVSVKGFGVGTSNLLVRSFTMESRWDKDRDPPGDERSTSFPVRTKENEGHTTPMRSLHQETFDSWEP